MMVESEGNPAVIGDGHRRHKAYGLFQIRQPAVTEVNRKFGLSHTLEEIRKSEDLQIAYCVLLLSYLNSQTKDLDAAVMAYNVGLSGYRSGKRSNYLRKVRKVREKL
jgi:hypothetical protein